MVFQLSSPLIDGSTNEMRQPVPIEATLDVTGSISKALTATNDPTTTPTGATYKVTEQITDAPRRVYSIEVPYNAAAGTLDLADVAPVVNLPAGSHLGSSLISGYFDFAEQSVPGTPLANRARLYARDNAGVSRLYYKDDAGTEHDIVDAAASLAGHEAAGNPHPVYTTDAEADVIADISSAAAVTAHLAVANPHPWPDGTLANPGAFFATDPNTGLLLISPDKMALGAGGVEVVRVQTVAGVPQMLLPDGVVGSPIFGYIGETTLGRYRASAGLEVFTGSMAIKGPRPYTDARAFGTTLNAATLQAAVNALPATGGNVFLGDLTWSLGATGITIAIDNVGIIGMGRQTTIVDYTGTGAAFSNANPATLRWRWHFEGFTIKTGSAGAGWRGLELDNVIKSVFRDLFINGTSGAGGTGIKLIGGGGKSTYFNIFDNVDIVANTACVDLGNGVNANRFTYGVWEGTGYSLYARPTTDMSGQNIFTDVSMQSTGANIVLIGGGGAVVEEYEFHACRLEPGVPTNFDCSAALRTFVVGGTWDNNVTPLLGSDGNWNSVIMPIRGMFQWGAQAASTPQTINLRLSGANGGITFNDVTLYRNGAGILQTSGTFVAPVVKADPGSGLVALQIGTTARPKTFGWNTTSSPADVLDISSNGGAGGWQGTIDFSVSLSAGTLVRALRLQAHTDGTSAKVGFFGVTPVVRPTSTTEIKAALDSLGLLTDGGASPLDLDGGAVTAGSVTATTGAITVTPLAAGLKLDVAARPKNLGVIQSSPFDILDVSSLGNTGGWQGTIDLRVGHSAGSLVTALRLLAHTDGTSARVGFFGTTPAARGAALTQTYSTADRTHAAETAVDLATTAATQTTPWGFASAAQADALATEFNKLRTDLRDLKQFVNSIADDLQAYGLEQ